MKKNSKKKKSVLKPKEKMFIIIVGFIMFILILGIALMPTRKKKVNNQIIDPTDLNRDLTTVQEVVEYLEATYISTENSKTNGYEIDIYVKFPYNLYEKENSKETYFKNFYEQIARVTKFKSFRLIDSSRNITIEVKCNNSKISEVKINGETDYFKKETSRRSKENELQIETLDLEVNSPELQSLIDSNWVTADATLGTPESKYNKYDIYFDEGYEIRTIRGKVYNIVFKNKYNNKVIEDYKPGSNIEKIEAVLGKSYKDSGIIGYKTKDFYVMFTGEDISIYPNYKNDYTEFEELVKEYNEKKDINDFLDKLTDIWPDYDTYEYNETSVQISYALKGVKIEFNSYEKKGIQIYENYKGELKEEKTDYYDTYYKLNKNLFVETETIRRMQGNQYDNGGIEEDPIHYSSRFYLECQYKENRYTKVRILSIDQNYPNNEFDDTIKIYKYVWADDSHLIYSINRKGIYEYDAESRETKTLLTGNDEYNITNYNRNDNILEYDGQKVKVEI